MRDLRLERSSGESNHRVSRMQEADNFDGVSQRNAKREPEGIAIDDVGKRVRAKPSYEVGQPPALRLGNEQTEDQAIGEPDRSDAL